MLMICNALAMARVMRDLRLSRDRRKELVHNRLRKVLVSAYLRVPYYKEVMREVGYNPTKDYHGPEDLQKLPITTKEVLKRRGVKDFISGQSDLSCSHTDSTSGSTGIPIRVYRGAYERSVQIAKWLRVLFVNGYSVRDRVMSFTEPSKLFEGRSMLQGLRILRRSAVDYTLDPGILAESILWEKPNVLYGNRSHLDLVALQLKERAVRVKDLKLVIGTGEVISESSRKLCREIYGVELVESYGSVEMGVMAYETPAHDGLHLCDDLTYFEFLDDNGQPVPAGEPGKVVVTDLANTLMPFIRYDHKDLAVYHLVKKKSGEVKRITKVLGRDDDYVILPDGSRWTYHLFYEIMSLYPEIYQYRIIQRGPDLFHILIVSNKSYFESIHAHLVKSMRSRFPVGIDFRPILVDRLEPDSSGKLRKFVVKLENTNNSFMPL